MIYLKIYGVLKMMIMIGAFAKGEVVQICNTPLWFKSLVMYTDFEDWCIYSSLMCGCNISRKAR